VVVGVVVLVRWDVLRALSGVDGGPEFSVLFLAIHFPILEPLTDKSHLVVHVAEGVFGPLVALLFLQSELKIH
jgi:hypothetical protein